MSKGSLDVAYDVLNGNLWLSLLPERALGDGGYPPYNIELVPANETALEALRIRSFALQQGVEVRKAELHNGLLTAELEKPERQRKVVKVGISATT